MALNALELKVISGLLGLLTSNARAKPSILFLGSPDLLCTPASVDRVGLGIDWDAIPKRSNARDTWITHNRAQLAHLPMLEIKGLIAALGASAFVIDAIPWGGEDKVVDLNYPVPVGEPWVRDGFDIIVDPGTVEHCFNVAQAFDNIDRLLAPGGFVYHQAAAAFPNHGFWSISPTAFFDFYQNRGYDLGQPYYWSGAEDEFGFVPRVSKADPFVAEVGSATTMVASYVFRKSMHPTPPRLEYPVQRCYSSLSRTPPIIDYFLECGPKRT